MKIGLFAKKNDVSIDTIRHYMDLHLLLPIKENHQYDFDDRCQKDFEEIQLLKSMHFTLSEIHTLIDYMRLTAVTSDEYRAYTRKRLEEKRAELEDLLDKTTLAVQRIDSTINDLSSSDQSTHKMGVSLDLLPLLSCPMCDRDTLILESDAISNNTIYNGSLHCPCGYHLDIRDGIIIHQEKTIEEYSLDMTMENYVKQTGIDVLSNIRKKIGWFEKNIPLELFDASTILEIGSGCGFFIRGASAYIDRSKHYIAIDHDLNRHIFLKNTLESSNLNLPIHFICCDFRDIPIKTKSVDILVDFTGTSNIGFNEPTFMLDHIRHVLKEDCHLLAAYIIFDKFSFNHFLPLENRRLFIKEDIDIHLKKHKVTVFSSYKGALQKDGGPYENYFSNDDDVYTMCLHGQINAAYQ